MKGLALLAVGPLTLTTSWAIAQDNVDLACWDSTFFYRKFTITQVSDGFEVSMAGLGLGNLKLRSRNLQDGVAASDLGYAKGIHVKFAAGQCQASGGAILCSDIQGTADQQKDRIFVERVVHDLNGYLEVISGFPVGGLDFVYKPETGATLSVFEDTDRQPAGTLSVRLGPSERYCDLDRSSGVQFPQRLRDFLQRTSPNPVP